MDDLQRLISTKHFKEKYISYKFKLNNIFIWWNNTLKYHRSSSNEININKVMTFLWDNWVLLLHFY